MKSTEDNRLKEQITDLLLLFNLAWWLWVVVQSSQIASMEVNHA
jgi:hypothetical protein